MSHVPADGIPHEGAGSIRFVFDALADGRDSLPAPRKWCHKFQLDVKNNFFALLFFPAEQRERARRSSHDQSPWECNRVRRRPRKASPSAWKLSVSLPAPASVSREAGVSGEEGGGLGKVIRMRHV